MFSFPAITKTQGKLFTCDKRYCCNVSSNVTNHQRISSYLHHSVCWQSPPHTPTEPSTGPRAGCTSIGGSRVCVRSVGWLAGGGGDGGGGGKGEGGGRLSLSICELWTLLCNVIFMSTSSTPPNTVLHCNLQHVAEALLLLTHVRR